MLPLYFPKNLFINGKIMKNIVLNMKGHDTLLVQFSKVDEAYFNYPAAYKRVVIY